MWDAIIYVIIWVVATAILLILVNNWISKKIVGSKLIDAAKDWNKSAVELLINNWVDINIQAQYWQTALMSSSSRGHLEIASFLIKNWALLDIQSNTWFTALMYAAARWYADVVKLLIGNWANLNLKARNWMTALVFSISENHPVVIRMLIKSWCVIDENVLAVATSSTSLSMTEIQEIMELYLFYQNDK